MMIGASIFHFAKGLASRNFFSWRDLARFTARQARLRVRGESHTDMHDTRDSALAFVAVTSQTRCPAARCCMASACVPDQTRSAISSS